MKAERQTLLHSLAALKRDTGKVSSRCTGTIGGVNVCRALIATYVISHSNVASAGFLGLSEVCTCSLCRQAVSCNKTTSAVCGETWSLNSRSSMSWHRCAQHLRNLPTPTESSCN